MELLCFEARLLLEIEFRTIRQSDRDREKTNRNYADKHPEGQLRRGSRIVAALIAEYHADHKKASAEIRPLERVINPATAV